MSLLGQGQAHESHLGPASEGISIANFLHSAEELHAEHPHSQLLSPGVAPSSATQHLSADQAAVAAECSVDDLRDSLNAVLIDPRLMANVTRTHQAAVHSIYETADTSNRRKRRKVTLPEPTEEPVQAQMLRTMMDSIPLKSWPLTLHAASFIRPPKHSDRNTLNRAKQFRVGSTTSTTHQALMFITILNKLSWGHRQLFRSSQHVLLSSQTLGELSDVIPCTSNELPKELPDTPTERTRYELPTGSAAAARETNPGCAICIDGTVYGDGNSTDDYSDKLLPLLLRRVEEPGSGVSFQKGASIRETTFASLSLQLHKPYWMLHSGNCEHYFLIDQIRLLHASDPPPSAYPLTTHITPPLLDLCRACSKVPAVYAINGDIRFGETPFVICEPCWRWMGPPRGAGAENVVVVPLPRHEHGWGG